MFFIRLGRLRSGGAKGPGIFFVIPCIDKYHKVKTLHYKEKQYFKVRIINRHWNKISKFSNSTQGWLADHHSGGAPSGGERQIIILNILIILSCIKRQYQVWILQVLTRDSVTISVDAVVYYRFELRRQNVVHLFYKYCSRFDWYVTLRSQLGSHDEALIGHHIYMTEQWHDSFTWRLKSMTYLYMTINYMKSSYMTLYLQKQHLHDGSLV